MVVTRQQPSCHMGQMQRCFRVVTSLQQPCGHNLVTRLWQGCNKVIQHGCYKDVCFVLDPQLLIAFFESWLTTHPWRTVSFDPQARIQVLDPLPLQVQALDRGKVVVSIWGHFKGKVRCTRCCWHLQCTVMFFIVSFVNWMICLP